ncbi:histone-lysine N-methyltransferase family member SUVH9-like [Magnolia sinica]|uniref:histone-lysine N-methyltransferase family member SUVH9-like n=1 Tax=Magnolia sinica TaxID=86752 RepID=UPI002658C581|nr:histone-lysine N-methyltransferase family member SUVH9-like [Magnolia sinica]XP_058101342.1 histone-lysine N-methyltransferase family member SUVH9-like [Magnolia sinica]XP_058101343.1 histone-lysine N-methyltransferase family member SUVH9-like [Magnolia sinica]XP_058101344.1 histone-lysine N-methyltransferase family member SUVH9-like [Magnolia sinica]XP_058101345.1 histone-lysine N-methyltransferase family member SUVH9-like [Magnolia sinica]
MASPIPFLDLNLLPDTPLISPKIEPKSEPHEEEPLQILPPTDPNPNPNPGHQISTVPETPPAAADDVYSEFLRISHLFRSAFAEKLRRRYRDVAVLHPDSLSIIPANHEPYLSSAIVTATRAKRHRSTEMVRVSPIGVHDHQHFRGSVRTARITYESLRLFLIQEEERATNSSGSAKRIRADLKAAAAMMDRGLWLNRDKRIIGSIPGVHVGDQFFFRMEMCVIGLHGQVQAGIDYVAATRNTNGEPIATSIIVSGGYEDDEDKGDVIIYTGHGGKERDNLRHSLHQKLEGGNLALERSRHYGIEVRVIRGKKCEGSPTGKVYVYDGLYRILEYWLDIGRSGFGVYKYKLLRIEGQPDMGSVIMKFADDLRRDPLSARPSGYLSLDISRGKEKLPVYLFNDVDCDRDPMFFDYLVSPVYPPFAFHEAGNGGTDSRGCDCTSGCLDGCYCVEKNGGDMAYDSSGILLRGKPLIYECGSFCRCPQSCRNRVTQKGVKHRLEVFRSRETGWGVRSLDLIRAGAFICEYTGIVLTKQQATVVAMNGDSLIYPDRFPGRWAEWGDISRVFPEYLRPAYPSLPQLSFAMDVSTMRNVACYFSHSCSPNVLVQFVLYDHYNLSYPHLMLFALENIPPLRELSIDYGVGDGWTEKFSP